MSAITDHVVEALAERVLRRLRSRGPGHCLQIPNVPLDVADAACRLVTKELSEPDLARVVVGPDIKLTAWRSPPASIVEIRNASEESGGKLALFVPAGQHVAVEDSFGRSTFEVVELDDLYEVVVESLRRRLQTVAPDLAERAETVVGAVASEDSVRNREVAAYLARVVSRPAEDELGRALVEVGLLPDSSLADRPADEVAVRVARNTQLMRALGDLAPPPDRIQALSIPPDLADAKRVRSDLADALHDGTVDRHEIARRLDRDGHHDTSDFGTLISALGSQPDLRELEILKLSGDFEENSEPPTIVRANARVQVKYRCLPAAANVVDLRQLRLELVHVGERLNEVAETGVEAAKSGKSLPRKTDGTWTLRVPAEELEPGVYRMRLRAIDADNFPFKETLSEPFRLREEIEEVDLEVRPTVSVTAARVDAAYRNRDARVPELPRITTAENSATPRTLTSTVRFDGVPGRWEVFHSQILGLVEQYTFQAPRSLARYRVSLGRGEIEETLLPDPEVVLPDAFLAAREVVLAEIEGAQYPREGVAAAPLVALADLRGLTESVERYVRAWQSAILEATSRAERRALLDLDQVTFDEGVLGAGVLVGPTHPLRLLWLTRFQTAIDEWLRRGQASSEESAEVHALVETITPANVPHVLVAESGELRHVEPMDTSWGLWATPTAPEVNALSNIVRRRLGLPRSAGAGVRIGDVVQRIRRYLAAHPYVELLEINFVHPGAAELVLQTLLSLQADPATENLRYVVRLFATELSRTELGRALDQFMADPEALRMARKDAADAFLASTDDPLTPKLTYSKHDVRELLDAPARFPAHLTFFLDWFDLDIVPAPPVSDRRSFFAGGLIVDPVSVYRPAEGDLNPQWDEHVATPDVQDLFAQTYAACERATAQLLDPDAQGTVPAVRLVLDRVRRSILDAVHRYSDWVVVIDPVFTEEYLDSAPKPGEAPRYLIDASDPGALEATRRIMISTRSRAELAGLLRPVLRKYDLDMADDRIDVLLDALRALGAGLPLKLLSNPTQAIEALSLGLATTFLAAEGVLRHAIVIPFDLHPDLFREEAAVDETAVTDLRRTDLAIIQLDPPQRRLGIHLVEVKARGQLPETTPLELIEHIDAQLENSRAVLRRRLFSAEVRQRRASFAGALMVRRLTRLLSRYTERALRYRFLEQDSARAAREFLVSLDRGFSIAFSKHALLFDLDGPSMPPERVEGVRVMRIGREQILDLLNRTQTPVGTQLVDADPENVRTVLGMDEDAEPLEEVPSAGEADMETPEPQERTAAADAEEAEGGVATPAPAQHGTAPDEGPAPDEVLLLGSNPFGSQFGIVGRVVGSGRDVAFDTDGTNVVSVFGVQGSGKSYTVGNLIEAALVAEPKLNRLPHPLAAIVFHYSTDQTYVPEFAAMSQPNDDPRAVELLRRDYGAEPTGVGDLRILVPEALLGERRTEFPDIEVAPLQLATSELTIDDWKLLMGVEGGDQLYVKSMTNIFRSLRRRLSFDSLREAIAAGTMTQQQATLAETRITFAEAFATDTGGAGQHVRPGGLLIVDVRDPLIEQDEALALFMVMLRLFSQARDPDGQLFNKLIVFDEAHKYMGNTRLTNAIVESVREMRHKGTSVVIASQNPPSVPREIIELSSIVIAHKFTSPQWLEHIRKVNAAFGRELTPPQLAMLPAGEAFVWSSGGAEEFRRPQRIRMRPRLTRHGGATRRAGGD
jgi:DNA helicase HerA-like ATPase